MTIQFFNRISEANRWEMMKHWILAPFQLSLVSNLFKIQNQVSHLIGGLKQNWKIGRRSVYQINLPSIWMMQQKKIHVKLRIKQTEIHWTHTQHTHTHSQLLFFVCAAVEWWRHPCSTIESIQIVDLKEKKRKQS